MLAGSVPAVHPRDASRMISAGDAVLIDVREADEWAEARIPGAEFRPLSTINAWYVDLPSDTTVIVQCQTGQRSHQVVHALMHQAGMDNVVNLAGGIVAWAQQALPVHIPSVEGPPAAATGD